MANSGSLLIGVLIVVSMLYSVSASRRDPWRLRTSRGLNFVPAVRVDHLTESACFTPNKKDDMYVAVPQFLFKGGAACNKTLRVSCAEPYRDLGGPWQVCKQSKIFTVTVIDQVSYDPLGDDLFHLSGKAFWRMAQPDADSIRLFIHQ